MSGPPLLSNLSIKWVGIAFAAIAVLVLVILIVIERGKEKVSQRWDRLAQAEERFEQGQGPDPFFEDPGGVYRERPARCRVTTA